MIQYVQNKPMKKFEMLIANGLLKIKFNNVILLKYL